MTMLDGSSPPADRGQIEAWLDAREDEFAGLVRTRLREIVVGAFEAWANSLTAAGDLTHLDRIQTEWITFVYEDMSPWVTETHLAGAMTAWIGLNDPPTQGFAEIWAAVVNENAVSYAAQHLPLIVNVGDATKRVVRNRVEDAIRRGTGREALKGQIERLTTFSEFRADTVARTEIVGAYVQGDLAGARALGEHGPVEKVWVATRDRRTRESHQAAHNQVVGFEGQFAVGGVMMDAPHDPGAPAGEVVNCRCYLELLYAGDARPDGSIVEGKAAAPPGAVSMDDQDDDGGDHVDRTARKWGVDRGQVLAGRKDVQAFKRSIKREADLQVAESMRWLDSFGGTRLRNPRFSTGGEYDWLERISRAEKRRLSGWWTDSHTGAIDVVFEDAVRAGAISPSANLDDFAAQWLHHTRVVDAGKSIRAGRWTTSDRFGGFDPRNLAPDLEARGFDIAKILGAELDDAAGYLARAQLDEVSEQAWRILNPSSIRGTPPWRLSYQSWEAEVNELEYQLRVAPNAAARARWRELVPADLDRGQDFETLYGEIIEVSRVAQLDVAPWAMVPWI